MKKWIQRLPVLAFILFVAAFVPYRTDYGYFCEFTGSSRTHTTWLCVIETNHAYQRSKLEDFIAQKRSGRLKHRWVSYMGTSRSLLGLDMLAHGNPKGLFYLPKSLFEEWLAISPDDKKLKFYEFLQVASNDEVKTRIDAMADEVLGAK